MYLYEKISRFDLIGGNRAGYVVPQANLPGLLKYRRKNDK